MTLELKLKNLPIDPGVYFFRDVKNEILYIGKAKNLRNRVRSYFQKNKYQTPKNQSMIARIKDLEWLVVRSEVEALLTEANLIKKHKPHYNISLKDDKSFPYIRITNEPYPRVFITRKIIKDGSKYFGPYTNIYLLRQSLKAVHKIFPVRSCDFFLDADVIAQKKVKLCLDYHIKKCQGPCEDLVSREQYGNMINRVKLFLLGKTGETERFISKEMDLASNQFRFEDAAMYRDQLKAITSFREKQSKIAADFQDRDVFALAREDRLGVMVVVRIRSGRIFSREKIFLQKLDDKEETIYESVLTQFYLDADFIPPEITVAVMPRNKLQIINFLKTKQDSAVRVIFPQRGEKLKEVHLAEQNAKLLLGELILEKKKRSELIPKMIAHLETDLQLKVPPRRIEAFDISHLGGTNTVASMVCFVDGIAKKSEYRKFKIKTVSGIDDFAAIKEVVYRRYSRVKKEQGSFPDLVLVDGGKGQLSMALSALNELQLKLEIIGLAKRLEEVFIPGQSQAQSIPKQSPGLILLRRIRDEAHRFAITFQRQKRKADITGSIFNEIKGMGPARVKKLLQEFSNVEVISAAHINIIRNKVSVSEVLAREIISVAKKFIS